MTKSDIATYVGQKVHSTDDDSISVFKTFVDRRYDMIWNAELWRESLGTYSTTVPSGTEIVDLTLEMDFPVSAYWDEKEITPVDYQRVFQINPALLDENGTPTDFIVLPKSVSASGTRPRIKLIRIPNETKTLLVLGKLIISPLGDSDEAVLSGIDNALVTYVEADALEYLQQYAKAQLKMQEAGAHMQLMRDMEKNQSARQIQIVPDVEVAWTQNDFR
jgi:hypothetical protein|tara:strand:- start:9139 stop:9795 length:657 start_codon:yes stop_codon:yes gene_type:complete